MIDQNQVHSLCKAYLTLPADYLRQIGGARWSDTSSSLEVTRSFPTLSYNRIALFLEGFASQRSLVAFGFVVHWLSRLTFEIESEPMKRLRRIFIQYHENWRNAGALAGMICADLPASIETPGAAVVCGRLRDRSPFEWFATELNRQSKAGEMPPMAPEAFDRLIKNSLEQLHDEDLASWLKFGRGPLVHAGRELAIAPPARTWGAILDELLARPRLAGAQVYVDQMISALAVPPRRHVPQQLPLGGYADVVTKGSVDRLLPSQHALDDLEFLRRFTENELLFFRREEPPAQNQQEQVIVLDQGVRTWGDVRLVLAGAALALASRADRRAIPCRFACTSRPGLFAPHALSADDLGRVMDASDLSRSPGLALEGVLERPSSVPRDLFLLTHPFALAEDDVRTAALRLGPTDRLFALTINGKGSAELSEMRRGLPVRLKAFHVDFVAATTPAAEPPASSRAWTGCVESNVWPFRFGSDGIVQVFDFDDDGRYQFTVYADSMIHVWDSETGTVEIVPRPMLNGKIVKSWNAGIGVAKGFALLTHDGSRLHLFHYDLAERRGKSVFLCEYPADDFFLRYNRRRDAVIIYGNAFLDLVGILNLSNAKWIAAKDLNIGPLKIVESETSFRELAVVPFHGGVNHSCCQIGNGTLHVPGWSPFTPRTEGRSTFFSDRSIFHMQLGGGVLAVHSAKQDPSYRQCVLSFFQGPEGNFLREITWNVGTDKPFAFRLSPDGDKVAVVRSGTSLDVHSTRSPKHLFVNRRANFNHRPRLWVGEQAFLLNCGRKGHSWHLVEWSNNLIVHSEMMREINPNSANFRNPPFARFLGSDYPAELVTETDADSPEFLHGKYAVRNGIRFVIDRYGCVSAYDNLQRSIFQFWGFGDSWSAWLPDGTRLGKGMIHEWPNSPNAAATMAEALRAARKRGVP